VLSMPCVDEKVIGGIDTDQDLHFAAAVDVTGTVLGERAFATTRHGYRSLVKTARPARPNVSARAYTAGGLARRGLIEQLSDPDVSVLAGRAR
jgi:hypothetical protein